MSENPTPPTPPTPSTSTCSWCSHYANKLRKLDQKAKLPALTLKSRNRFIAAVAENIRIGKIDAAEARALLYAAQLLQEK